MTPLHRLKYTTLVGLLVSLISSTVMAESDAEIQQGFNQRYQEFLGTNSQMPLPFNRIDKDEWKKRFASQKLRLIFADANRFYNNKTYTFKLYQATDDGVYYLDAIGGFWGMEELVYGPISETELK